jgi:hypothetical protein
MVYFQTKNSNLGKFLSDLDWKMLIYLMAICDILWAFGILYDHLVHSLPIWYIFPGFGNMHHEKSGKDSVGLIHRVTFYSFVSCMYIYVCIYLSKPRL